MEDVKETTKKKREPKPKKPKASKKEIKQRLLEQIGEDASSLVTALARAKADVRKVITSEALKVPKNVVRYLVDTYYQRQEGRKATANQLLASSESQEPNVLLQYLTIQDLLCEETIHGALDSWCQIDPAAAWFREARGIGPVISAALCAYIDLDKAKTPSAVWRFFGLDPTAIWKPKCRRPWCHDAKLLAFRMGRVFQFAKSDEKCLYGQIYRKAFDREVARNESGEHEQLCKDELQKRGEKMSENQRSYYEKGRIPDQRVILRAMRKAVKVALAHFWTGAMMIKTGKPQLPVYIIGREGHTHEILPPQGWPKI